MSKGLDLAKAEAALKRAAYKALHGTREERSGRFLAADKQPLRRDTTVEKRRKAVSTSTQDVLD